MIAPIVKHIKLFKGIELKITDEIYNNLDNEKFMKNQNINSIINDLENISIYFRCKNPYVDNDFYKNKAKIVRDKYLK